MGRRIRDLEWINKKREREERKNNIVIKGMGKRDDRARSEEIYKRHSENES